MLVLYLIYKCPPDGTEFHVELDEKLHILQKFSKRSHKLLSLNLSKCNNLACFDNFHLMREKWPNTEFFLVLIFLYSVRVQENTDHKKLRV